MKGEVQVTKNDSLNSFTGKFGRLNQSSVIMDCIIDGVQDSDEWIRILNDDPRIQNAEKKMQAILATLPRNIELTIDRASNELLAAYIATSILYGMRVMIAMYDSAMDPAAFSRQVLESLGESL